MDGLTWGVIAAVLTICCSLCSVASFYFGRRKAATDQAKAEGSLKTDLHYIKETVRDTTKSLDSLAAKLDTQNQKTESDYRKLLIQFTELRTRHDSVETRVLSIEKEIARYHHNG